jgi:hypothetical protein
LVTGQFAVRATDLSQIKPIERGYQFITLVTQWLGYPEYRRQLIEIERCVTLSRSTPLLGRALGRENDPAILAGLRSAFEARRLHALRIVGPISSRLITANGRTWKFEDSQIVERDSAVEVRDVARFLLIKEATTFSSDIEMWLRKPISRQTVLDLHKAISGEPVHGPKFHSETVDDKNIVSELLTAWSDGKLYLLKRRTEGGSWNEEPKAESTPAPIAKAKTKTPPRNSGAKDTSTQETTIKIRLYDVYHVPISGAAYKLAVGGSTYQGTSGKDGMISQVVPGTPTSGRLTLDMWAFNLTINPLNAADDREGYSARLDNLGYFAEDSGMALMRFQSANDLDPSGQMNDETKAKLEKTHGH